MFAMTFYKCLTSLRMGVAARMPIMSVFLRDGVFWFLAALSSWLQVLETHHVFLINESLQLSLVLRWGLDVFKGKDL